MRQRRRWEKPENLARESDEPGELIRFIGIAPGGLRYDDVLVDTIVPGIAFVVQYDTWIDMRESFVSDYLAMKRTRALYGKGD